MMLDISDLNDRDLRQFVAERCSEFGSVDKVEILRVDQGKEHHFAIVRMSAPAEGARLFMELGASKIGDSVAIRLERFEQSIV